MLHYSIVFRGVVHVSQKDLTILFYQVWIEQKVIVLLSLKVRVPEL